jgi:hypothetical protein
MNASEFRESIESAIPVWAIFATGFVLLAIAFVFSRSGKHD